MFTVRHCNGLTLLDFVSSAKTECPDELDMLLETLSDSDIQLLDSTNLSNNTNNSHTIAEAVGNASNDVLCHDTCSSHITDHTSSTSAFALTTEVDLKRLKDKNKNTIKSTVTWINRFDAWRKVRGINNELENIPENELDHILQSFFAEICKSDGTKYEPESLRVMLSAMD